MSDDEITFSPGSEDRLWRALGDAVEIFILSNVGKPSADAGAHIVGAAVSLAATVAASIGLSRDDLLDIVEDLTAPEPEAVGHA